MKRRKCNQYRTEQRGRIYGMKKLKRLIKTVLTLVRSWIESCETWAENMKIIRMKLFDVDFYNRKYGYSFSQKDGLHHYQTVGWREGHNPSPLFDAQYYLSQNIDVAAANICPLTHYVRYGAEEGRKVQSLIEDQPEYKGVYQQNSVVYPCFVTSAFEDLKGPDEDGIFLLTDDAGEKTDWLLSQIDYFYDESIMAVLCLPRAVMASSLYPTNYFVSKIKDLNNFTLNRELCLFRGCRADLIARPEIWSSDYAFTDYLLQNACAGMIMVLNSADVVSKKQPAITLDDRIARFHYITKHFSLAPNAVTAYFHSLCAYIQPGEEQIIKRSILQNMGCPSTRVMISIYSFSNGGGEMQPIRLANELKRQGVPVIVHVYALDESTYSIRRCLRFDIPVVYLSEKDALKKKLQSFAIDCINTHHCSCQVLASSAYYPELNHVATSHGMFDSMNEEQMQYLCSVLFKDRLDYWTYVADKNTEPFRQVGAYSKCLFAKIDNGIEIRDDIRPVDLTGIGIDEKSFVVCLASRAIKEKGWLEAMKAVEKARKLSDMDIRLVLVGSGPVYDQIKDEHPSFVYPVGLQNNVLSWFSAADICILPTYYSCESFPLTVVEALQCCKPIIATDIGEIAKMMSDGANRAGELIPLHSDGSISVDDLTEKIVFLAQNPEVRAFYCSVAKKIRSRFDIKVVAEQYLDVYGAKDTILMRNYHAAMARLKMVYMSEYHPELCPKVSVIVPNYNYAHLLPRRLDSIYSQTYKNFEVILLDDVSTDNSREILEEYCRQHKENTKVYFNTKNLGVFGQWKKGMKLASGELCWIAEADDWCEDTFLECLVPLMLEHDVRIAYGQYVFAQDEQNLNINAYKDAMKNLSNNKWESPYIESGETEVHTALGIRNTLVNVSGLLFSRPKDIDCICSQKWEKMKVCGDWLLYLKLLKHGRIAYCPDVKSYFRIDSGHTSASSSAYTKEQYYQEHAEIMAFLRKNYAFSNDELQMFANTVREHCDALLIPQKRKNELMEYVDIGLVDENSVESAPDLDFEELPCFLILSVLESNTNEIDALELAGGNTGNLVFNDAAKKEFKHVSSLFIHDAIASEFYGRSVIGLSNSILFTNGTSRPVMRLFDTYANNFGGQLTILGLGSQSSFPEQTPEQLVETLSFQEITTFRKLAAKSHSIGIRGEFTARCLDAMGIRNYQIIGCPSIYLQESYEHMKTVKPCLENPLVTFTRNQSTVPYKKCDFVLMQLGAMLNAGWCMQTLAEYPEDLIANSELDPAIKEWVKKKRNIFFNCKDWKEWLQKNHFTFCFGSRFHGNMMAFQNGIPTLWVNHDSRTKELLEFLHLPYVDSSCVTDADCVSDLIQKCNYHSFLEHYPELRRQYLLFLKENGVVMKK